MRAEFFKRGTSPQKASNKQWLDGCQTIQDALDLGVFDSPRAAISAFASKLADAVRDGRKLGFSLQEVQFESGSQESDFPEHLRVGVRR